MAGYSGTPLTQKLGIKTGSRVAFVSAPPNFLDTLGALPPEATSVAATEDALDVIVCFVSDAAAVEQAFLGLKPRLAWTGGLWLAWPKKVPGQPVTIVENTIRDIGLAAGLVDNKVCAVDDRWSGLRFVWRTQDRPKAEKKTRSHTR